MAKIVATYLVKVTLREPEGGEAVEEPDPRDVPTNDALVSRVESSLVDLPFDVNATSERTDR